MLTSAQLVDVRRWLGYQLSGTTQVVDANTDTVYVVYGTVNMSLFTRLTTLSADEETTLVNVYLNQLTTLESAIAGASSNLDTDQASVWKHNKNEVADRTALFKQWSRQMAAFLGVSPGPGLGDGGMRIMRG